MAATCKTCGGSPDNHQPSVLDPLGIGNPAHKMAETTPWHDKLNHIADGRILATPAEIEAVHPTPMAETTPDGGNWKPYKPGIPMGKRSHIKTTSGEKYYQCLFVHGYFLPLLDDRRSEIPDSEVAYILDADPTTPRSDKDACPCVCHGSTVASWAYCEHCKGDNAVRPKLIPPTPDTQDALITEDELIREWGIGPFGGHPAYLTYFVEVLNGEKTVETAREDILSFRPRKEIE